MSRRLNAVIVDESFPHHVKGRRRGLLVGVRRETEAIVVGYCAEGTRDPDKGTCISSACDLFVRRHYPAGCAAIGWWVWNIEPRLTNKQILSIGGSHNTSCDTSVVMILSENEEIKCFECCRVKEELVEVCVTREDVGLLVNKELMCLRLCTAVDLCQTDSGRGVSVDVTDLQRHVREGILFLPRLNRLLHSRKKEVSLGTINDLKSPESLEIIYSLKGNSPTAPVITLTPTTSTTVTLVLDVLGMFNSDSPIERVHNLMIEKLADQLDLIGELLEDKLSSVGVHHFSVPTQHVPITVVYPHTPLNSSPLTDSDLTHMRKCLHEHLCLPLSRPFLRSLNVHWNHKIPGSHLVNPHVGVKTSRVPGGTLATVQGYYAYHHYMQDSFNDDGWGCAYRSLQTLWSWFKLQGYTALSPPSHHKIQQTLIELQDKEPSFLDSQEWIGSYEVSMVLNHHLKVDSKLHHCSTGADMATSGRVLLRHFNTQGTPVMIGGGVLAHTIVGVDFNELTGEVKFLIVDPHYTGRDDLKIVQDKGWCGWKTIQFWDKQAHYNMCLPQRPEEI